LQVFLKKIFETYALRPEAGAGKKVIVSMRKRVDGGNVDAFGIGDDCGPKNDEF